MASINYTGLYSRLKSDVNAIIPKNETANVKSHGRTMALVFIWMSSRTDCGRCSRSTLVPTMVDHVLLHDAQHPCSLLSAGDSVLPIRS